ncbi:7901_t:CDS:2 [Racocetra persica]|uniref:7901_t:CDS:1 n=1 Tax=Racocetra persica TaxID=160502 RepID=A0ACA9MGL5_9GLOM|nr:7901_t:CDS:2 [Racocetra persica]
MMLSQLFTISALLLVGVTTVAIGSPVKKTIDIVGVPGVPQCPDNRFPNLMYSFCFTEDKIRSVCESSGTNATNDVDCPEETTCVDLIAKDLSPYAYCAPKDNTKRWSNGHDDGIVCTDEFVINNANGLITMGVTIYDVNRNTIQVDKIYFYKVESSSQIKYTAQSLSLIVDYKGEKLKACLETGTDNTVWGVTGGLAGSL